MRSLSGALGAPEPRGASRRRGEEETGRRPWPGYCRRGVKEDVQPSATGGGGGQELAAAPAKSATPSRVSGAGGDVIYHQPHQPLQWLTSAQLVKRLKKEKGGRSSAWKAAAVHPARRAYDASTSSTPLKETPESGATLWAMQAWLALATLR